jgi:hypothetical protein
MYFKSTSGGIHRSGYDQQHREDGQENIIAQLQKSNYYIIRLG